MIAVTLIAANGDSSVEHLSALPRIGEAVVFKMMHYKVSNVIHTIPDRYTASNVRVVLQAE